MWIEEIFVNAFGAFNEVYIKDLTPGLNILVGPNEAGKTTLLEFVRSILFGFRKKAPKVNTHESIAGKTRSGWLTVQTPVKGRLRIERTEKSNLKEGLLRITDEQANYIDPSSLNVLVDGADRRLFQSFFAFDLDNMKQLDQNALRGKIVATALGSFLINPLDVMRQIEDRIRTLGKRSTRDDKSLEGMQFHIKEIDKRLKLLRENPKRYELLKLQLDSVNNRFEEIEADIFTKESMLEELADKLRFEKDWRRLIVLDREIERLESLEKFPADGLLRLEQFVERLREFKDEMLQEQKILEHLRVQHGSLNVNDILVENNQAIHVLGREAMRLAGLPKEIERIESSLERSNDSVEQAILELGSGWNRERVKVSETSMILEQEIRSFTSSMKNHSEIVFGVQSRLAEADERCAIKTDKLKALQKELQQIEPHCEGYLSRKSLHNLQQWKEIFTRLNDLQEKLRDKTDSFNRILNDRNQLKQKLEELQSASRSIVPVVPFWILVVSLFVSGGGLLLVSNQLEDQISIALLPAGLLIVFLTLAIVIWKFRGDHRMSKILKTKEDNLINQLDLMTGQIAEIKVQRHSAIIKMDNFRREIAGISKEILGNPHAGPMDIMEAEQRSSAAEEPFRRYQELNSAVQLEAMDFETEVKRRGEIEISLLEAKRKMQTVRDQWTEYLNNLGFDTALEPETALETVRRLREIKKAIQSLEEEQIVLDTMRTNWQHFSAQVGLLRLNMGCVAPAGVSPVDEVEMWMIEEKKSRDILEEKKVLSEKIKEREVRQSVLAKKIEEAQDQITALLERAGAPDEEAFRERGALHERFREINQERQILLDNLVCGLRCQDEAAMRRILEHQDWVHNHSFMIELQNELEKLRSESKELANQKGRFEKEIETLEAEEEFELLLASREKWLARLQTAAAEWIDLKIASSLLNETLKVYESEKQPRVLERTSRMLETITGGAVKRILLPLNGNGTQLERWDSSRIDENLLSRGTLEQMYLSLRLAYLESNCDSGCLMPILMDDVLVNFDPSRAKQTAVVLAQFAKDTNTQVLFLTCHPHTVNLFPTDARIHELGLVRSYQNA